jgi:hypothetical protein
MFLSFRYYMHTSVGSLLVASKVPHRGYQGAVVKVMQIMRDLGGWVRPTMLSLDT